MPDGCCGKDNFSERNHSQTWRHSPAGASTRSSRVAVRVRQPAPRLSAAWLVFQLQPGCLPLGGVPGNNYISFRFEGGGATRDRRSLRAIVHRQDHPSPVRKKPYMTVELAERSAKHSKLPDNSGRYWLFVSSLGFGISSSALQSRTWLKPNLTPIAHPEPAGFGGLASPLE